MRRARETMPGAAYMKAGRGDPARRAGRAIGRSRHVRPHCTRRAADCGLRCVRCLRGHAALAQSGQAVRNIRVDVAPLRANAGDPTATWVEQELPRRLAQALAGRLTPRGGTLTVRIDYLTLGPNTGATIHGGSSPDNIIGRGDDRQRAMAGAGDDQLCGLADRPDDDRAVQSLSRVAARAGAGVLDRQRSRRLTSKRGFAPLHSLRLALRGGTSSSVTGANMPLLERR